MVEVESSSVTEPIIRGTTKFHKICQNAKHPVEISNFIHRIQRFSTANGRNTTNFLQKSLQIRPNHPCVSWSSVQDDYGRIPLHLLSLNIDLLSNLASKDQSSRINNSTNSINFNKKVKSNSNRDMKSVRSVKSFGKSFDKIRASLSPTPESSFGKPKDRNFDSSNHDISAEEILHLLVSLFPEGLTWVDAEGFTPFIRIIASWICDTYEGATNKSHKNTSATVKSVENILLSPQKVVSDFKSVVHAVVFASPTSFPTAIGNPSSDVQTDPPSLLTSKTNTDDSDIDLDLSQSRLEFKEEWENLFPKNVTLPSYVASSFTLISYIIDHTDEILEDSVEYGLLRRDQIEGLSVQIRTQIVESLANIPYLLKTIVSISEKEDSDRILSCSIMKEVLFAPNSIGKWLVSMLKSNEQHVRILGVEYLQYLSHAPDYFTLNDGSVDELLRNKLVLKQSKIFKRVSELDGFIPSLLMLDEGTIEQVATTSLVQDIMEKLILGDFALSTVFFDAVFLAILIYSFGRSSQEFIDLFSESSNMMEWLVVANACLFYFTLRELGQIVSLSMLSCRVMLSHKLRFWSTVDYLSIILSLICTICMRIYWERNDGSLVGLRTLIGIATLFLWLKVIGLLKSLNMELATFILATEQITQDIKWFLVFLVVVVLAGGQIFFITLFDGTKCQVGSEEYVESQCKVNEYYLWTYKVLLGDIEVFNQEEALESPLSYVFFIVFTFLTVIVLLNILIAIVSDSHEKCLIRSDFLFGRARLFLMAELVSFQYLLRPLPDTSTDPIIGTSASDHRMTNLFFLKNIRRKWRSGTIIYFGLSFGVFVLWTLIEISSHTAIRRKTSFYKMERNLFVVLFYLILVIVVLGTLFKTANGYNSFFSSSAFRGRTGTFNKYVLNLYDFLVHGIMRSLFGKKDADKNVRKSSKILKPESDQQQQVWLGRMNYVKTTMEKIVDQSSRQTKRQLETMNEEIYMKMDQMETSGEEVKRSIKLFLDRLRINENRLDTVVQAKLQESEDRIRREIYESEERMKLLLEQHLEQVAKLMTTARSTASNEC